MVPKQHFIIDLKQRGCLKLNITTIIQAATQTVVF